MKEIPWVFFHYFERIDFNMTASLLTNSDKWALADITLSEAAQAF